MKKKLLITSLTGLLVLTGCSGYEYSPPSPETPVEIEALKYEVSYIKMPNGIIITCFEDGAYNDRVLTCHEGSQDYSNDEVIPVEDSIYSLSYVKTDRELLACFEGGAYNDRVLSCFPYEKEGQDG